MEKIITPTGIKAIIISNKKSGELPDFLSEKEVDKVRKFHSSIKGYKATPLISLENLAKGLGVSKIFVKDESYRFGLNAFKGVGATYAIARVICEKLGVHIDDVSFDYFKSPEVSEKKKIWFLLRQPMEITEGQLPGLPLS
jgi:diaminopropionate ammonia-lyase